MISVVIPLYNKEKSITTTLQSVIDQTHTDWECIVVNDGSTDNSLAVLKNFVDKLKIEDRKLKIVSKQNEGVSSARNNGIQEARGKYVAFLDGDDIWDKEYLAEQVKMIHDFPNAAMWGINFAETRDGQIMRRLATGLPDGYRGYVENYFYLPNRDSDLFCSSSVVIRKEVFEKVGMFDERLKYSEDNDMWWRIIATYPVVFYDKYMVFYRYDAENRTLSHKMILRYDSPFVVDKYQVSQWKENKTFYAWINRHSAQWIARYLFNEPSQRSDAYDAAKKLDYGVIPFKYRLLLKTPYWLGEFCYKMIKKIKS